MVDIVGKLIGVVIALLIGGLSASGNYILATVPVTIISPPGWCGSASWKFNLQVYIIEKGICIYIADDRFPERLDEIDSVRCACTVGVGMRIFS